MTVNVEAKLLEWVDIGQILFCTRVRIMQALSWSDVYLKYKGLERLMKLFCLV